MIDHLDQLLRHLLLAQIPDLVDETHIRFQPPDQDWRAYVGNLDGLALNVYLVDVRENRVLHSNQRVRSTQNGIVSETAAPRRVDCHYLVSAWSPASASAGQEPTLFEHGLLYQASRVLLLADPLIPRKAYFPDPLPPTFPEELADAELPMAVLPPEGFPKFPEFWGTMGSASPWRPAAYLRITLQVLRDPVPSGPMVTTTLTDYGTTTQAGASGLWAEIGGHVLQG